MLSAARVFTVVATCFGAFFTSGCGGHDDHGAESAAASVGSVESAQAAPAEYLVRREGAAGNGQRTVFLSRSPELGELSVQVSESVTADEAREVANFLLAKQGVPFSSRIRSISESGPSRWLVVVEAQPSVLVAGQQVRSDMLCDPLDDHVTITRRDGALEIASSELVARP